MKYRKPLTLIDAYLFLKSFDINEFDSKVIYLLHLADKKSLNNIGKTITGEMLPIKIHELSEQITNGKLCKKIPYGNLSKYSEECLTESLEKYGNCPIEILEEIVLPEARTIEDFFRNHPYKEDMLEQSNFDLYVLNYSYDIFPSVCECCKINGNSEDDEMDYLELLKSIST